MFIFMNLNDQLNQTIKNDIVHICVNVVVTGASGNSDPERYVVTDQWEARVARWANIEEWAAGREPETRPASPSHIHKLPGIRRLDLWKIMKIEGCIWLWMKL